MDHDHLMPHQRVALAALRRQVLRADTSGAAAAAAPRLATGNATALLLALPARPTLRRDASHTVSPVGLRIGRATTHRRRTAGPSVAVPPAERPPGHSLSAL